MPNTSHCLLTHFTTQGIITYRSVSNLGGYMDRLKGLDVARGFALLGMMLVNYKLVFEVQNTTWLYTFLSLFEGRAVAVFMILAGIGIGLMTRKARISSDVSLKNKVMKQLVIRAIFLWVLGLTLFIVFEWSADILHYYGAYMLLILPVLYLAPKKLDGLMVLILVISVFLQVKFNYLSGWDIENLYYMDFYTLQGFLRNLLFNGFHPLFPWFAFMVLGLRMSHMDLMSTPSRLKILKVSLGIAIITELASAGLIAGFAQNEWILYLVDTKPMPANLFYMIASAGWAIAFIILVLMAVDRFKTDSVLIDALMKTGQMALTHYVVHSAVLLTIASMFGLIKEQTAVFVLLFSLSAYGAMVIFSSIWSKKFQRGPIESLMRRLSDGRA